jgi:hypothetical protein
VDPSIVPGLRFVLESADCGYGDTRRYSGDSGGHKSEPELGKQANPSITTI